MTFYSSTYPRARKAHTCYICYRRIDPGETYRRGVGIDGTAWTFKECAHCDVLLSYLIATDQVWDDDGYDSTTVIEWDPESIEGLRIKAYWKSRWRHADGTLRPIPLMDAKTGVIVPDPQESQP